MHIPDGIVPVYVCAGGFAASAAACGFSISKTKTKDVPKIAVMTAAFFVTSLLHIPIPPSSAHFILNGLIGVILGPSAFIGILVGLFFQAVFFQHGGLLTLGVNAFILGMPAIICSYIFDSRKLLKKDTMFIDGFFSFISGCTGVALSVGFFAVIIIMTIPANINANTEAASIGLLSLSHIPIMILEGIFTVFVVLFLKRIKPEILR